MSLTPLAGDSNRAPAVRDMFERLAPRYDLANRVLSLGLDQSWRRSAVRALGDAGQGTVLDLCAGTLDLSCLLVEQGAEFVHAMDFSEMMLEVGAKKLPDGAPVKIQTADARDLPLPSESVDGILCGFGLRNVPEVHRALAECSRVLKPGGRLVVLDFFQPQSLLPRIAHGLYNRFFVPLLGGMITGYADAYRYLQKSISAFNTQEEFEELMRREQFQVQGKLLFPPVASIVIGTRDDA